MVTESGSSRGSAVWDREDGLVARGEWMAAVTLHAEAGDAAAAVRVVPPPHTYAYRCRVKRKLFIFKDFT